MSSHILLQNEGVRGLFNGMMPRMLRRTFMAAFTWAFYEEVRSSLSFNNARTTDLQIVKMTKDASRAF